MPVLSNNTVKVSQKTALISTSKESAIARNKADRSLNGTSASDQSTVATRLNSTDYKSIGQAQQQEGQFSSNYKNKNYSIDTRVNEKEFCSAKTFEQNMCPNTYEATVESEVKDRSSNILLNVGTRQNEINPSNFGENSIVNSCVAVQENNSLYAGYKNFMTSSQIAKLEKQKAAVSSSNTMSTLDQNFMILIKEERVIIDGLYTSEPVTIPIYQMPLGGFQFGTQQVFDPIEPRGSQSPMRFYNKNPGRVLSFGVQLHQQEYPTIPLLIIAEALQDLARPYQHTDYSLIPKVVQVLIPGRTFRCYLESVRITSQGEDYQSWQNDDINGVISSINESTNELWKKYKHNILEGNPELKGMSSQTRSKVPITLHYGLSAISCDLNFIILEEIKLIEYTSNLEFMAIQVEENKLKLNKQYEEALNAVGGDPNDVIVNKLTGEVIFPIRNESGEWFFAETELLNKESLLANNPNAMTLQQFKNQNDNSDEKNQNLLTGNEESVITNKEILSSSSTGSKITLLIKSQSANGNLLVSSDGSTKRYTLEELQNLKDEEINALYKVNVYEKFSEDNKELHSIGSKFIAYQNEDETGYAESTILSKHDLLVDLFDPKPPTSIDEIPDFIRKYIAIEFGIEGDKGFFTKNYVFTPLSFDKDDEIEIRDENGYTEEVYLIKNGLSYPNGIYVIDNVGTRQDYLGYSFIGTVRRESEYKKRIKEKNKNISEDRIEELYESLKTRKFLKSENSWITFGDMCADFDGFKKNLIMSTTSNIEYDISDFVLEDFQALVPVIRSNMRKFFSKDSISRIKEVKCSGTELEPSWAAEGNYIPTEKNILYYMTFDIKTNFEVMPLNKWN